MSEQLPSRSDMSEQLPSRQQGLFAHVFRCARYMLTQEDIVTRRRDKEETAANGADVRSEHVRQRGNGSQRSGFGQIRSVFAEKVGLISSEFAEEDFLQEFLNSTSSLVH